MFSIIIPIIDPFDRFVKAGAIQTLLDKILYLQGDFEVIIVINTPAKDCPLLCEYLESIKNSNKKIKIINADKNLGTARGFNRGFQECNPSSEFLVFVSSDTDVITTDLLVRIESIMKMDSTIGIGHPYSVWEDSDDFNISSKYSSKKFYNSIKNKSLDDEAFLNQDALKLLIQRKSAIKEEFTDVMVTPLTFAVYRRSMIESIGGFDEGILYGCYETDDLAYRALKAGYRVVRFNRLLVNHRRHFIRKLVLEGTPSIYNLPHTQALSQATQWWHDKYKIPYVELYFKHRYGAFIYSIAFPWFLFRRLLGRIKKIILKKRWNS